MRWTIILVLEVRVNVSYNKNGQQNKFLIDYDDNVVISIMCVKRVSWA